MTVDKDQKHRLVGKARGCKDQQEEWALAMTWSFARKREAATIFSS